MTMQPTHQFGKDTKMPTLCLKPRGLAIFPVRYAVVPKAPADLASIELPGHMGDKTKDVGLEHHKYALRQVREGFIYVYFHQQPKNKRWKIYKVKKDGSFGELGVPDFKNNQENIILAGLDHFFIDIEIIEQGSKVDFAFSTHPWSKKTLTLMEQDSGIRNRRMQTFIPQAWAATASPFFKHGMSLSEENLQKVFEFSGDINAHAEIDPSHLDDQPIADTQGKHNQQTLELSSTNYHMPVKHADTVKEVVKKINIAPNQKNQPMNLALWDSVGITKELDGFALDAMGWVDAYNEQFELHLNAIQNIEFAKEVMRHVAKVKNNAISEVVDNEILLSNQREQAQLTRKMELIERRYQTENTALSIDQFDPRYSLYRGNLNNFKENYSRLLTERKQAQDSFKKNQIINSWDKHQLQVNDTAIKSFKQNRNTLAIKAKTIMNQRVKDMVSWLESPWLVNALTEYHKDSKIDGLFFEDLVGDIVICMSDCDSGKKKLEQWVKAAAITDDNLFWRAMASNINESEALFTPVPANIQSNLDNVANINSISGIPKDVFDRLKDIVLINEASLHLAEEISDVVGQNIPTGGVDKIYSAFGSRLITPLIQPGVDSIGGYITSLLYKAKLHMDVGAEHTKYQKRLKELDDIYNNRAENISNTLDQQRAAIAGTAASRYRSMHEMLSISQGGLDHGQNQLRFNLVTQKRSFIRLQLSYNDVLEQITQTHQERVLATKNIVARPGSAFGVLILALHALSIGQLNSEIDAKGINPELSAKLTLGALSIATHLSSQAVGFLKNNSPWEVPLKTAALRLTIASGVLTAVLDFDDIHRSLKNDNTSIVLLLSVRTITNSFAVVFTAASLYASINIAWEATWAVRLQPLAGYLGKDLLAKGILSRLFLTTSILLTVIVLVIDIVIAIFSDDDLENWLQRTPFALKPEGKRFKEIGEQQAEFEETIIELLGLKRPHFKNLERELNNDHYLNQMKREYQLCEAKKQQYIQKHNTGKVSEAEIAADAQFQSNQYKIQRLNQQIKERTQEITEQVDTYNNQQQNRFANAS